MDDANSLECDLLVLGAGMAGLTAGAYAARNGLNVIVVDKGTSIGGSAILSGGGFWSSADYEAMRQINPEGEPHLARVIADHYDEALEWIKSTGTSVNPAGPLGPTRFGESSFRKRFFWIDIVSYLRTCESYVNNAGGYVVANSRTEDLLRDGDAVVGAVIGSDDGTRSTVRAKAVLLATGGFQNDPEMRATYLGGDARNFLVRSNPHSSGDGISLGLAAGGVLSRHMDSWYGHTVPYPLNREFTERDYIPLAQFALSPRSVILDRAGTRFVDESMGYYFNAQAVASTPGSRALLVFDERTRQEDASVEFHGFDRPVVAKEAGANVTKGSDWSEVAATAAAWGYSNVDKAVHEYNNAILTEQSDIDPPRKHFRRQLDQPPYYAMEIQPAITFTFGGLRIDANARVLDSEEQPVEGLYAAGADAGGVYHQGYAGGLSMGAIFGIEASKHVRSAFTSLEHSSKDATGA
ncbi:FAD-dependent oxidoreductase [Rhodococcus koreensis]